MARRNAGHAAIRSNLRIYQGQCRYPDEIAKLKAAKAGAAEARRRAEEEKRKAEEEKRKAEEAASQPKPEPTAAPEPMPTTAPEPTPVEPPPEPADTEPAPTAAPAVDPAPPPPAQVEDEGGISPLVWVGFGVAAAGSILGGITGGISLSQASDLEDQCPNDVCPPDKEGDVDGMMTLGHVSTVSFVVAGVGAAVGVVGLLLPGGDESPEGDVALQPVIGPGVLGLRGVF